MDVTSLLSVPVFIMEPFTILQKAAEIMEYTELLDSADKCTDPHERCVPAHAVLAQVRLNRTWTHALTVNMRLCTSGGRRFAYLAAYCVSPFGSAERAWKPFNPILGETFELEVGNGVRYLAEQVRHQSMQPCTLIQMILAVHVAAYRVQVEHKGGTENHMHATC